MASSPTSVLVGGGLGFAEGVNFDRDGTLYCVDIPGGAVCRMPAGGILAPWVMTGGNPNGSRFGPGGDLFIADQGRRAILRLAMPAGEISVVADTNQGTPFLGPNDLCFGPDGTLYFTDPFGSSASNPIGAAYAVGPDGTVSRVASSLAFPNGLAVTPDGGTLIVGTTHTGVLHRYSLDPASLYAEQAPLATLSPAGEPPEEYGPDGMAFGADGNLYVAHFATGHVEVLSPEGRTLGRLASGAGAPTNVAFWKRNLYVTDGPAGEIYRLDIGVGEQRPFGRPW